MSKNNWNRAGICLSIAVLSFSSLAAEVVEKTISMEGWLGDDQSEMIFSESTFGMQLVGSSESDCDFENYHLCIDGESNLVSDSILTTNAATNSSAGFYQFSELSYSTDYVLSTELFPGRSKHQVVNFQNKLWVIGGKNHDQVLLNDVWASSNGKHWVEQTSNGQFPARSHHQALSFDNKLWLFGGVVNGSYGSDIWSSSDGITWQEVTPNIALTMSGFTKAATFDNKVWLLDFDNSGTPTISSSSDGETWSVTSMPEGLTNLSYAEMTEFNGKLRVMGAYLNDIELWVTENGTDWTQEDDSIISVSAGDGPDKIFVHGGSICFIESATFKDLYCSTSGDANTWSRKGSTSLDDYDTELITNLNETLYLVGGGIDLSTQEVPPLKFSNSGTYWLDLTIGTVGYIPETPEVTVHDSKIITMDKPIDGIVTSSNGFDWKKGYPSGISLPASYKLFSLPTELLVLELSASDKKTSHTSGSAENGSSWQEVASNLPMDARSRFATAYFDNKLWVIGGYNLQKSHNTDTYLNDVWSSEDGISWTEVTASAAFTGQENHSVTASLDSLWLLENETNAVWASSDGETWVQKTASSVTPVREFSGFTSYKGKLWIIGGVDSNGQELNDIWSSVDGISWTREVEHASFPTVFGQKLITLDERLFMIRGESNGSPLEYVWSSTDGVNWYQGYEDELTVLTDGYALGASASEGGSVEVITPVVARGTRGTIELDADTYFELDSVDGCAGDLNEDTTLFTTALMSAECTLNASFRQVKFRVNSSVNNSGFGYISPSFGRYDLDQSQTFEITLNSQNLEIESVTGCNGVLSGTSYQVDGFEADCQIDLVISVIEETEEPIDPVTPEDPVENPEEEIDNIEETNEEAEAGGSLNPFLIFFLITLISVTQRRSK